MTTSTAAGLLEHAAVEQHAHGLDRVERDAVGAPRAAGRGRRRAGPGRAREQLVHRAVVERLERQRRGAPHRAPGSRMAIGELRAREREDEDRVVARPVEQVLDERR